MATQTVKGFMFMEYEADWAHDDYDRKWWPRWHEYKPDDHESRVFVREMDITFDLPADFDPIPRAVAALEAEKAAAMAEYQRKVAEINERLSKLQAITYQVA